MNLKDNKNNVITKLTIIRPMKNGLLDLSSSYFTWLFNIFNMK